MRIDKVLSELVCKGIDFIALMHSRVLSVGY